MTHTDVMPDQNTATVSSWIEPSLVSGENWRSVWADYLLQVVSARFSRDQDRTDLLLLLQRVKSRMESIDASTPAPIVHKPGAKAWLRDALSAIYELRQLEDNWDSYGGDRISQKSARAATDLLNRLNSKYSDILNAKLRPAIVAPLPDGGIQMEWEGLRGRIEIEIHPEAGYDALIVQGAGEDRTYETLQNLTLEDSTTLIARTIVSS